MSFNQKTSDFLSWLAANAVEVSPKVRVDDLRASGQGRCVFAADDIAEDEQLFSIPRSAILNVETCSLAKDFPNTKAILSQMTQWDALILVFVYEWKKKGPASPWAAYFDVLPVNDASYASDQLVFWEESEVANLNPSYIVNRIGHDSAAKMYRRLLPRFEEYVGEVSTHEFRLVASVIMSYSFDVGNDDEEGDDDEEEGDEEEEGHEHDHEEHEHGHENGEEHGKEHGEEHGEEHGHEHGEEHGHEHGHENGEEHDHEHVHKDNHSHDHKDHHSHKDDSHSHAHDKAGAESDSSVEGENTRPENGSNSAENNSNSADIDSKADPEEELVKNSDLLKSMVPLADTLNADSHKHNASLYITKDRLVMRSIKPIAKNSQIYNIYSEHPNSEILRRYGYVEQQGSAHDFAEVSLATFKKYFSENSSLSQDTIDEIFAILEEIEAEEEEKFVLDTYDCFATGEVIFELTFLTQLFVIIAAINHKKSFNSASSEVKARAIRRVYKKSYQLLEARKLTAQFMKDFPNILKVRLSEYPRKATRGFPPPKDTPLTRPEMALVVLASECISLQNCMDTEKVFVQGEHKFSIIDDEKLLRNIMKKDTFEGSEPLPNKKKRIS